MTTDDILRSIATLLMMLQTMELMLSKDEEKAIKEQILRLSKRLE